VELEALNALLRPQSIAVIGASNTPGKIGYLALKNLIDCQYPGKVYPIKTGKTAMCWACPAILPCWTSPARLTWRC
jgi:acyl-CoA synthetase (NDP forming)